MLFCSPSCYSVCDLDFRMDGQTGRLKTDGCGYIDSSIDLDSEYIKFTELETPPFARNIQFWLAHSYNTLRSYQEPRALLRLLSFITPTD